MGRAVGSGDPEKILGVLLVILGLILSLPGVPGQGILTICSD